MTRTEARPVVPHRAQPQGRPRPLTLRDQDGTALPQPSGTIRTDAVIVPTGAAGRIERGLQILRHGGNPTNTAGYQWKTFTTGQVPDPAISASKASAYGLGLNWYLNENLKWVLNYERTRFDGGAAGGADREDEEAFLTRVALGF